MNAVCLLFIFYIEIAHAFKIVMYLPSQRKPNDVGSKRTILKQHCLIMTNDLFQISIENMIAKILEKACHVI